jgi:hypothetical protein
VPLQYRFGSSIASDPEQCRWHHPWRECIVDPTAQKDPLRRHHGQWHQRIFERSLSRYPEKPN